MLFYFNYYSDFIVVVNVILLLLSLSSPPLCHSRYHHNKQYSLFLHKYHNHHTAPTFSCSALPITNTNTNPVTCIEKYKMNHGLSNNNTIIPLMQTPGPYTETSPGHSPPPSLTLTIPLHKITVLDILKFHSDVACFQVLWLLRDPLAAFLYAFLHFRRGLFGSEPCLLRD